MGTRLHWIFAVLLLGACGSDAKDASAAGAGGTGGVWTGTGTGSTTGSVGTGTGTGGTGGTGTGGVPGGTGGIGSGGRGTGGTGTGGMFGGTGGFMATPLVCPPAQPMDGSTCTGGGRGMSCPYAGDTIECSCQRTGGGMTRAWNCDMVMEMDGGI